MQSRLDQEYFRQPDHTRSIQETNVTFQALQWSLSVIALILKPMDSWMIVRRFQTPISFAKQAVLQPTSANFSQLQPSTTSPNGHVMTFLDFSPPNHSFPRLQLTKSVDLLRPHGLKQSQGVLPVPLLRCKVTKVGQSEDG